MNILYIYSLLNMDMSSVTLGDHLVYLKKVFLPFDRINVEFVAASPQTHRFYLPAEGSDVKKWEWINSTTLQEKRKQKLGINREYSGLIWWRQERQILPDVRLLKIHIYSEHKQNVAGLYKYTSYQFPAAEQQKVPKVSLILTKLCSSLITFLSYSRL